MTHKTKTLKVRMTELEHEVAELRHKLEQPIDVSTEPEPTIKDPSLVVLDVRVDDDNQLLIELDWDKDFPEFLRNNGINGTNDTAIVNQWLSFLGRQTIEKMGNS